MQTQNWWLRGNVCILLSQLSPFDCGVSSGMVLHAHRKHYLCIRYVHTWIATDHTICQVQYYKLPFFCPFHFLNELKWSIHWLSIVIVNGSNVGSMTRRSLEPAGSCEEILSPTWSNKLYQSDWTYLDISYEFDWKLIVFCANKVDLILSEGTHSAMLM